MKEHQWTETPLQDVAAGIADNVTDSAGTENLDAADIVAVDTVIGVHTVLVVVGKDTEV